MKHSVSLPLFQMPTRLILCSLVFLSLLTCFTILIMQIEFFRGIKQSVPNLLIQSRGDLVSFWNQSYEFKVDQVPDADEHVDLNDQIDGQNPDDMFLRGSHILNQDIDPKSVAIACAVTSRNMTQLSECPLFKFLPSFCRTVNQGWKYHFYLSHDHNDPLFTNKTRHKEFEVHFFETTKALCKNVIVNLHFVRCSHSGNPAWAQNDAVMEAYIDNHAFFYRINDDTIITNSGWTEAFTERLAKYEPPNIGVVGPNHIGGNMAILTYDFTHHTHITVFGFHYPRCFKDWYADTWMTKVYKPERSTKMPMYKLQHTLEGRRYDAHISDEQFLEAAIKDGKETLQRYIQAVNSTNNTVSDGKKIISMSLYRTDACYIWGAIRNAQTVPVFFPEWTLRIYIEKPGTDGSTKYGNIPARIINKLKTLGAQIAYVDLSVKNLAPIMWRYLVADDLSIDYFIVRDTDSRLSDRDAVAVTEWIKSGKVIHCIRDHPNHCNYSLLGGLWGGKPKELHKLFQKSFLDIFPVYSDKESQDVQFLTKIIWPKVHHLAYCHESVSCQTNNNSHPFPVERTRQEYIGQTFGMFGEVNEDILCKTENSSGWF